MQVLKTRSRTTEMIVVLGPTASGKTGLAVALSRLINGAVISADSRQVYKGMDIGTGKDLDTYRVGGHAVDHHLIDIREAGEEYTVYHFKKDALAAKAAIEDRGQIPVLCGGTGMYLDALLFDYHLETVPVDEAWRASVHQYSMEELESELRKYRKLHNTTDTLDRDRLLRAIEIARFGELNPGEMTPGKNALVLGIQMERAVVRRRITERLQDRLDKGMLAEVEQLMHGGVNLEKMKYYGLEYKLGAMHLAGEIGYDEMFTKLNTAIHQYAKRQMTWFRRMEKRGLKIHWIDGMAKQETQLDQAMEIIVVNA